MYRGKLAEWATGEERSKMERDFLFVYVWTLCKILADLSCEPVNDKLTMENYLTCGIMEKIDRGRYRAEGSFMGWLFMQAATLIRDCAAQLYKANIHTLPIHMQEGGTIDFPDEGPEPDYFRLVEEIHGIINNQDAPALAELMHIVHIQDKSVLEAGRIMGISSSMAGRLHAVAMRNIQEVVEDEYGTSDRGDGVPSEPS